MSGICGVLRFDGEMPPDDRLDRMLGAPTHRGPHRKSSYKNDAVGLGHLLMRVTREDLLDRQPLNAGGIALVADLRLDNREELADALGIGADVLSTLPDSALLHRAYLHWQEACAEHLLGDFAFAVWDMRQRKLVLGRDHMGQRVIHYHRGANFFAFATEPKALLALPEVPRQMSEAHLARVLFRRRGRVDDPQGRSFFDGIDAVGGGTVMAITADGSVTSHRYWVPRAAPEHENRDEAYYIENYRLIVGEAVACRIRRTLKPAGLFLSGGMGSAAIAGLAGPVVNGQGRKLIAATSVKPVADDGVKCRARSWTELCARAMPHLDVRYVTAEARTVLTDMEKAFLTLDRLVGHNHYVTEEMFALLAAAGAGVVMDGYGDDYSVNPRANDFLVYLLRTRQWRRFCAEFAAWRRVRQRSVLRTVKADIVRPAFARAALAWRRCRGGQPVVGPVLPMARDFARRAVTAGLVPKSEFLLRVSKSPRAQMRQVARRTQDGPQGWSIAAAQHGLEFTQPFHDKRVIEFGLAIPEDLFVKEGWPRPIARAALADVYPAEFQDRLPDGEGIGPDFRRMAESIAPYLLSEIDRMEKSARLTRYFDFPRMRRMITHYPGGATHTAMLGVRAFMYARYVEWFHGDNR